MNRPPTSFSHSVCGMSRLFGVGNKPQMIEVATSRSVGVAFISVTPLFPLVETANGHPAPGHCGWLRASMATAGPTGLILEVGCQVNFVLGTQRIQPKYVHPEACL